MGRQRRYIAAEVIEWRARNVKQRRGADKAPPEGRELPKLSPLADKNDPFIRDMLSGKASPLTITRAAAQMASRRVAKGAIDGTLGVNDLDGLKKSLQELRAAEADYVELEKKRRELVEASEVEEIVGTCCARLVRAVSLLEASFATEVNVWVGDEGFRSATTDERTRRVRAFVARQCRAVREQEAKGARALMAELADADAAEMEAA